MLDQVKKEKDSEIKKIKVKHKINEIEEEKSENLEKPETKENENTNLNNKINEIKANTVDHNEEKKEIQNEKTRDNSANGNDQRMKQLEKEKDEKIKSVLAKFGTQISQLEAQIKQNKSIILFN